MTKLCLFAQVNEVEAILAEINKAKKMKNVSSTVERSVESEEKRHDEEYNVDKGRQGALEKDDQELIQNPNLGHEVMEYFCYHSIGFFYTNGFLRFCGVRKACD